MFEFNISWILFKGNLFANYCNVKVFACQFGVIDVLLCVFNSSKCFIAVAFLHICIENATDAVTCN